MTYEELIADLDVDIERLNEKMESSLCPEGCFQCCTDVATMTRISGIEAEHVRIGLQKLDTKTRRRIYDKAIAIIKKLEEIGWTQETAGNEGGLPSLEDLRGTRYAECPMLIDGRCAIYNHRPIVCRAWGYPIVMSELSACDKTTIFDNSLAYKPIYYPYFEQICNMLSKQTEITTRIPNTYLVKLLIDQIQSPSSDLKNRL